MAVREVVAEKMLEDKDTRMALASGVKAGASAAKTAFKWVGIVTLAGVGAFALYKITTSVVKNISESSKLKTLVGDYDKSKVTLSNADLAAMVEKIYAAFVDYWAGYDDNAIKEVLNRLSCKEDWLALVEAFGRKPKKRNGDGETYNLIWFLNDDKDGWVTYKDYAKILADKGINNVLGSLNGKRKKRKKKKGFFKKLLNPATPFKAVAKGTKAVNKAVKKRGLKTLLNPGTGFKIVQKSIK